MHFQSFIKGLNFTNFQGEHAPGPPNERASPLVTRTAAALQLSFSARMYEVSWKWKVMRREVLQLKKKSFITECGTITNRPGRSPANAAVYTWQNSMLVIRPIGHLPSCLRVCVFVCVCFVFALLNYSFIRFQIGRNRVPVHEFHSFPSIRGIER